MTEREINTTEWAVLALVAERETHGFEIARVLQRGAAVGDIWTIRRPLVYRALETLEGAGLIVATGVEPSESGPPRRRLKVTSDGRKRVRAWLREPVTHVRDARSLLLLKLLFLDRSGGDPAPLARAQAARFGEQLAQMEARLDQLDGFDRTAMRWRIGSTRAAIDFLAELT
jgi:DNA-binding PadR family transcriptional regulator